MGFNLESDVMQLTHGLRKRIENPKARTCYHQHGPVFHIHGETVNILPIDDKVREEFVNEMVRKYEQRSGGI